jgi:hypothetical protein
VRAAPARHALVRVEVGVEAHVVHADAPGRDGAVPLRAGEHGDVAARHPRPQRLAHLALPPRERARELDGRREEAVVHGAELDAHAQAAHAPLGGPEPGHATDHRKPRKLLRHKGFVKRPARRAGRRSIRELPPDAVQAERARRREPGTYSNWRASTFRIWKLITADCSRSSTSAPSWLLGPARRTIVVGSSTPRG